MNMVEDVIGSYGNNLIFAVVGVGIALICLAVVLWLIKRRGGSSPFIRGGRNRQPRLQVLDAAAVDARRRLVLVRRDNVEHLVMIGGPTDIVIESGIGAIPVLTPVDQRENLLANTHYDNELPSQPVEKREPSQTISQPREVTHEPTVKVAPEPVVTPAPMAVPAHVATPTPASLAPPPVPAPVVPAPAPVVAREPISPKPAPPSEPFNEAPQPGRQEPLAAPSPVAPLIEKPPVVAAAPVFAASPVVAPPAIVPPIKPAAVTQTVEPAAPIIHDPRFSLNELSASDILESARNRVLPDREEIKPVEPAVRPAAAAPTPAPTTLPADSLSSDFEKFLEAEMAKSAPVEQQQLTPVTASQQPARREPSVPPISGASTENEIQKEMARIFGEMSVTRDR